MKQHNYIYLMLSVAFLFGCESVPINAEPITRVDPIENPIVVLDDVDSSPVKGKADGFARIAEPGWSRPVRLPVNEDGREDATYITRDGRHILFYYDPRTGPWDEGQTDFAPTIYYTKRPFVTKEMHPVAGDEINAEIAPYISESGEFYYSRTWIVVEPYPHEAMPIKSVKENGEVLDLGTGRGEGDIHHCAAEDEIYFTVDADDEGSEIAVYKDGVATTLPKPINLPRSDELQPFVTDDCQTLYFTSTRVKKEGVQIQIYKSSRLGEFKWSEPKEFVSFPSSTPKGILGGGAGEFSMTRDGKQLIFIELTITENKKGKGFLGQNEIYYAQRVE